MANPTGINQYTKAGRQARAKADKAGIDLSKGSPARVLANRMIHDYKGRLGLHQSYVGAMANLPKPPKPKAQSNSLSATLGRKARGSGLTPQERMTRAKVRGL